MGCPLNGERSGGTTSTRFATARPGVHVQLEEADEQIHDGNILNGLGRSPNPTVCTSTMAVCSRIEKAMSPRDDSPGYPRRDGSGSRSPSRTSMSPAVARSPMRPNVSPRIGSARPSGPLRVSLAS